MTSLFMSLSVNDYLVISAWMIMIALILFAFCFYAIDENLIIAGSSFILALFVTYGLFTFNPEKISEYGTMEHKHKKLKWHIASSNTHNPIKLDWKQ